MKPLDFGCRVSLILGLLTCAACGGNVFYEYTDGNAPATTDAVNIDGTWVLPNDAHYVDGAWVLPDGGTYDSPPPVEVGLTDSATPQDSKSPADSYSTTSTAYADTATSLMTDAAIDLGPDAPLPAQQPEIGANGYITLNAGKYVLVGQISADTGGSGSTISLTFDSTSFCASGTVGTNTTYSSWAQAGFAVDQAQSQLGGGASPLLLTASSITLSFSNTDNSPLRIQLSDTAYNYWCYELDGHTSPITIPLTSFNTQCWEGGKGTAFVSGTAIQTIEMVVPGSNTTATPFDFCFLGMSIN